MISDTKRLLSVHNSDTNKFAALLAYVQYYLQKRKKKKENCLSLY